jgi:GNAT superfamily N-acetyltransferase
MAPWAIRRAVAADADDLSTTAQAAKRHWGYPEPWLVAWRPTLTFVAEQVEALQAYVIEDGALVGGFYVLVPGTPRWTLDHLWVRPEVMGQGLGRQLVSHALIRAREAGAMGLEIEADPNAESFYRHLGGRRVSEVAAPVTGAPDRRLPLLVLDEIDD